jgi:hypothetical protein
MDAASGSERRLNWAVALAIAGGSLLILLGWLFYGGVR